MIHARTFQKYRLKMVADIRPSGVDKHSLDGELPVQLCNYVDVYKNDRITSDLPFMVATATDAEIGRFALQAGDVVITKDSETADDIAAAALVDQSAGGVVCGYHLALLRPRTGVSGNFLFWTMKAPETLAQFSVRAQGVTRFGLTTSGTGGVLVPIPALEDQLAIAAFLDRETGKIDALVAEQERLIALLEQKRIAVITQAVTKGLYPNVLMKPSGAAWVGEVPLNWTIGSLKRFWTVIDCKHLTAEFVDDGMPLASIREVQGRFVNLSSAKQTTKAYYDLLIADGRMPRVGDLIFSRNATVGEVSQVAEWHPPFAMGQDVCLLTKQDPAASSDFLQAVMWSRVVVEQLALLMVGSTFKRVNVDDIRNLIVPVPPPTEQAAIARFVDGEMSAMDNLVGCAQQMIRLLYERRSALISAAVTGRVDVRNYVELPSEQAAAA